MLVIHTLTIPYESDLWSDPMPKYETTYRSYLLRLWRSAETGFAWRFMLESVTNSGERHYFRDLESLAAYLMRLIDAGSPEMEADM
jgi:hypothetical protein